MKTYLSKLLLASMAILMLASCGRRTLLDETHSFDNNTWKRFEPEVFKFDVKNIDVPYVVAVADSNARHTLFPSITLIDRKGQRRGNTVERYCTVVDTLDHCRLFNEQGRFTYRIKQRTSKYEIGGIAGLGLRVSEL